jgi:hypothetical protein
MVKGKQIKKVISLAISALFILLIFFILAPPGTAVRVYPGKPDDRLVTTGAIITFNEVNLTIRGTERIPVNNLTFKVYNKVDNQMIGYVKFDINGSKIEDFPEGKFTVTNTTPIQKNWYQQGDLKGTDEEEGKTYNFGYGPGFGNDYNDITFLYKITYKTHVTGTFYTKLFVNSTLHTFISAPSSTFTVSIKIEGEYIEASDKILDLLRELYGISLLEPFYATDTDGDGILDTFIDPNGILTLVHITSVDGNPAFLISIDGDRIPEFLWEPVADTVTQVMFIVGNVVGTECDVCRKTFTEIVRVQKSKWVYIQVTDQCPTCELTVKTSDGRIISSDRIWRENNKVYVLDDPVTDYLFIWKYTDTFVLFNIYLQVAPDPIYEGDNLFALVALINVGEPGLVEGRLTYNIYQSDNMVWSRSESMSVQGHKAVKKTISTKGFKPGRYTLEVIFSYGDGQTAKTSAYFTISTGPPLIDVSLLLFIIIAITVIVLILFILYKTGFIYIEYK